MIDYTPSALNGPHVIAVTTHLLRRTEERVWTRAPLYFWDSEHFSSLNGTNLEFSTGTGEAVIEVYCFKLLQQAPSSGLWQYTLVTV